MGYDAPPAPMDRSEEEILHQESIKLRFGKKTYHVKPLSISKSREWRKLFSDQIDHYSDLLTTENKDHAKFSQDLREFLIGSPEEAANLFFAYDKTLPRVEIEEMSTDAQMMTALLEVLKIVYPFGKVLEFIIQLGKKNSP